MKSLLLPVALCLLATVPAAADELDAFLTRLNVQAQTDGRNFRAQLDAQFKVGSSRIDGTLKGVSKPADAFMVLQLSQWSGRQPDDVMKVYRSHGKQGWGAMAKELGIKPGSKEFHALKKGNLHFVGDEQGRHEKKEHPGKGKDHGKH